MHSGDVRLNVSGDPLDSVIGMSEILKAADLLQESSGLLKIVAVHLKNPHIGGLFESQRSAILDWYERVQEVSGA